MIFAKQVALAVLVLGLCLPQVALAAPLEDGLAAAEHGNYADALRLLTPLAEQGVARAQSALGEMYYTGHGVPRDAAQAAQWYRKAADQGSASAQNDLARLYYGGHGVPQSDTEAAKWFRMAAERGDMQAQFDLGLMCEAGQGVPRDLVQAYKWYALSAARSSASAAGAQDRALRFRDRLATRLTPTQLAEAQKLAQDWRPL